MSDKIAVALNVNGIAFDIEVEARRSLARVTPPLRDAPRKNATAQ